MSLVTCAQVGEALEQWLNNANDAEKAQLCAALGCGPTDEEIAAVFLKCDSSVHLPGDRIPTCEEMDQAIEDALANLAFGSSNGTVNVTGGGTATNPYMLDVALSTSPGNRIEFREDGIGVFDSAPPNLAVQYVSSVSGYDGAAGTEADPLRTINEALNRIAASPSIGTYEILLKAGETFLHNEAAPYLSTNILNIGWYGDPKYGKTADPCPGVYADFMTDLQRPTLEFATESLPEGQRLPTIGAGGFLIRGIHVVGATNDPTYPGGGDHLFDALGDTTFFGATVTLRSTTGFVSVSSTQLYRRTVIDLPNSTKLTVPIRTPGITEEDTWSEDSQPACPAIGPYTYVQGNVNAVITPANIGLATDPATKTIFGGNTSWDIFI